MITKKTIIKKSLLTGLIYAILTCIVQVPIAEAISWVFDIQSEELLAPNMVPIMLLAMFVYGVAIGIFYYLYAYLFSSESKWKQGMKFGMFVFMSNYVPQVFFLDASKGIKALVQGGFPVIQVELYDFIIVIATVLIMVSYMPYRDNDVKDSNKAEWWKCLICGVVFAASIFVLHELILPLAGFGSMAKGLGVTSENIIFFYSVMMIGFILTGYLISYYAYKIEDVRERNRYFIGYGVLIWCVFDLSMIPLGFGVLSMIMFIIISMIAVIIIKTVYKIMK